MANERNKPGDNAAESPKAHQAEGDLLAVVEQMRKENEQMRKDFAAQREIMMAVIRSQPKVSPDTIWAQQHEKEVKIKEELDRLAEEFQKTCQQRTQAAANKLNPEVKTLFRVSVGWCPEIIVRAQDADIAKTRYNKLCGINWVNPLHAKPPGATDYKIVDVTSDPSSQEIVNGTKQWPGRSLAA